MKKILRIFLIETIVLYLVSQITTGLTFANGTQGILITGLAFTAASFLIKPVVSILILPLNLLTFGLFKWVGNAITLFLVDLVLPQLTVGAFHLKGYHSELIVIPAVNFAEGALSYLAFSFLISIITTVIYWLVN